MLQWNSIICIYFYARNIEALEFALKNLKDEKKEHEQTKLNIAQLKSTNESQKAQIDQLNKRIKDLLQTQKNTIEVINFFSFFLHRMDLFAPTL